MSHASEAYLKAITTDVRKVRLDLLAGFTLRISAYMNVHIARVAAHESIEDTDCRLMYDASGITVAVGGRSRSRDEKHPSLGRVFLSPLAILFLLFVIQLFP